MKTKEIIDGLWKATCEAELVAHFDMIEMAIDNNQCTFDLHEWLEIQDVAREVRANTFKRVLH